MKFNTYWASIGSGEEGSLKMEMIGQCAQVKGDQLAWIFQL